MLPPTNVGTQVDLSSEGLRSQAHQIERGSPQETVWVAEGLRQFEVVVVLSHKQLHRFSSASDRGSKFTVLALKFGGLAGAICDD